MAIQKQEFYEGAAIYQLIRKSRGALVSYASPLFVFDERLQVHLKYSTAKRSPWGFTFMPDEQVLLRNRAQAMPLVIGLICGADGIAALPPELHVVFRAINEMEQSLRNLIAKNPGEEFRGVYLENGLQATRRNVLVPGAIGVYTGGGTYNPAQVLRDDWGAKRTPKLDKLLADISDKSYAELSIADIKELIELTVPDPATTEHVWDPVAVAESLEQCAEILKHDIGYVYVDRDRDLRESRRETQGLLTGGEARTVPDDRVTVYAPQTQQLREPSARSFMGWDLGSDCTQKLSLEHPISS